MMPDQFESAFGKFIEQQEYDGAAQAIFSLARAAFLAGWLAAGGDAPQNERLFRIIPSANDVSQP
mgnify:CR=1 FL=1